MLGGKELSNMVYGNRQGVRNRTPCMIPTGKSAFSHTFFTLSLADPYRRSLYQLIVIKYKVKCIKVVDYKVRRWYNGFTEIRKGSEAPHYRRLSCYYPVL
jgi:hypothetical protein